MLSAMSPSHLISIDPLSNSSPPTTLDSLHSSSSRTYGPFQEPDHDDSSQSSQSQHQSESIDVEMSDSTAPSDPPSMSLQFDHLPTEIHEAILDHLFGVRGAALAAITATNSTASSWSKTLRHPRRKVLSDLALVSPIWRPLVQERIYRHS